MLICRWALIILGCIFLQSCTSTMMAEQYQLGKLKFNEGSFRCAFRELIPVAAYGDARAQYAIGYMYYYGYGVPRDCVSGMFWMGRSAEQGFPPAMLAIDLLHKKYPPCPDLAYCYKECGFARLGHRCGPEAIVEREMCNTPYAQDEVLSSIPRPHRCCPRLRPRPCAIPEAEVPVIRMHKIIRKPGYRSYKTIKPVCRPPLRKGTCFNEPRENSIEPVTNPASEISNSERQIEAMKNISNENLDAEQQIEAPKNFVAENSEAEQQIEPPKNLATENSEAEQQIEPPKNFVAENSEAEQQIEPPKNLVAENSEAEQQIEPPKNFVAENSDAEKPIESPKNFPSENLVSEKQTEPVTCSAPEVSTSGFKPAKFGLQLFGAYQLADTQALQRKLHLQHSSHIWHTLNHGKDWYVLVYGKFSSHPEAQFAMDVLPTRARSLGPWVRNLNGLEFVV